MGFINQLIIWGPHFAILWPSYSPLVIKRGDFSNPPVKSSMIFATNNPKTSIYSSYSVVQWISQRPLMNLWWTPVASPCAAEVQATTTWMCRWRHPNDAARQETRRTCRATRCMALDHEQIHQICRTFRFTIQPIHIIYICILCILYIIYIYIIYYIYYILCIIL